MSLDHAILGFLQAQPMTGYDLKTRGFDRAAGHIWTADQAQVYRTLERLERAGLVTSRLIPQPGRPDRREFAVTYQGRQALHEWLETPHPLPPLRDPLLLQLFFSADLSDSQLRAVLETARDGYARRLEQVATAREATEDTGREARARRMTFSGAAAQTRAAIEWIDSALADIATSSTNGAGHEGATG